MDDQRQSDPSRGEHHAERPLSLNTVFTVLSNQRRRTILSHLTACKYPVPFEELVETLATQETEANSGAPSNEVYERIAVDLYHTQLPKLADFGVIEYENRELIQPADTLRLLDEFLYLAEQHEDDWQTREP